MKGRDRSLKGADGTTKKSMLDGWYKVEIAEWKKERKEEDYSKP